VETCAPADNAATDRSPDKLQVIRPYPDLLGSLLKAKSESAGVAAKAEFAPCLADLDGLPPFADCGCSERGRREVFGEDACVVQRVRSVDRR